jgi:hypothetical protein
MSCWYQSNRRSIFVGRGFSYDISAAHQTGLQPLKFRSAVITQLPRSGRRQARYFRTVLRRRMHLAAHQRRVNEVADAHTYGNRAEHRRLRRI